MADRQQMTFAERAELSANGVAHNLYQLMSEKETNLCLALDETDPERFLGLAAQLGPELAILKTHVDTLEGYTSRIAVELENLSREHHFLIFEDRKFADIGNTVKNQYTKGVFHIIEWADIINAHALPGPGIIEGLRAEVAEHDLLDSRALLLLAQMSSAGNLLDAAYTAKVVAMAKQYPDFVIGFIGAGLAALPELVKQAPPELLIFTPGVKLQQGRDQLGQQFQTPEDCVAAGADLLVVGRDIYQDAKPLAKARQYREIGWQAYQKRIQQPKVKQA